MQLNQGVSVVFKNPVSNHLCFLQQLGVLSEDRVSFEYLPQDGFFQVLGKGDGLPLLHSPTCPCWNRIPATLQNSCPPRLAAIALVRDRDDNFLLTRRHTQLKSFPRAWVFPGGMAERGQDLETECLRELNEETGIEASTEMIEFARPKLFYESVYPTVLKEDQMPSKQTLCLFFDVKLHKPKEEVPIKIQETEVDQYLWLPRQTLTQIVKGGDAKQEFQQLAGIYPNKEQTGIGYGHFLAFKFLFAD